MSDADPSWFMEDRSPCMTARWLQPSGRSDLPQIIAGHAALLPTDGPGSLTHTLDKTQAPPSCHINSVVTQRAGSVKIHEELVSHRAVLLHRFD